MAPVSPFSNSYIPVQKNKKNDKCASPPSFDLRYNTFDIELFAAKSMRGRVSVVDEENRDATGGFRFSLNAFTLQISNSSYEANEIKSKSRLTRLLSQIIRDMNSSTERVRIRSHRGNLRYFRRSNAFSLAV